MILHLEKNSGRAISFGGSEIADHIQILGPSEKRKDLAGVTLRDFVLRNAAIVLADCSQCTIENAYFIGRNSGVIVTNAVFWSEHNTFSNLHFIDCQTAMAFTAGGSDHRSLMRQHIVNIHLSHCDIGIQTSGASLRGSVFHDIKGNFPQKGGTAMIIGGNMRGATINHVNFEGGDQSSRLFLDGGFDKPIMRPKISNVFYHGHEKQIGIDLAHFQ